MAKTKEEIALANSAIAAVGNGGQLVELDLEEIDTSFENTRTGDVTQGESKEDGSGQSHEELCESIQVGGQRTPAVCRPFAGKGRVKYQLISGFRRYQAINSLRESTGEPLKLKCIVKNLDDLNATIENVAENQRENLRGPDLMQGLWRIYQLQLSRGTDLSSRQLAGLIGKKHAHVIELMAIRKKAPDVAVLWHEAKYSADKPSIGYQLPIRDMRGIAKIEDKAVQLAKYQELLDERAPKEEGEENESPEVELWLVSALKKAEAAGEILGHLERRGVIKTKNPLWVDELETLGIRVKKGAKKKERNKIATKVARGFKTGLEYVEPEVSEEEEEAAE